MQARLGAGCLVEHAATVFVQCFACFGEALATRRAVQEGDAEVFLQRRDALADDGARTIQALGCGGEAARFDYLGEAGHIDQSFHDPDLLMRWLI